MKKIRGVVFGFIYAITALTSYAADYKVSQESNLPSAVITEHEVSYISIRELTHLMEGKVTWNNRFKSAVLTGTKGSVKVVADSNVAANMTHTITWLQYTTFIKDGYLYIAIEDVESLLQIKIVCKDKRVYIIDAEENQKEMN